LAHFNILLDRDGKPTPNVALEGDKQAFIDVDAYEMVTKNDCNVLDRPDPSGKVVGKLPGGQQVRCVGHTQSYQALALPGHTRVVFASWSDVARVNSSG
jgi:hypothetical protein